MDTNIGVVSMLLLILMCGLFAFAFAVLGNRLLEKDFKVLPVICCIMCIVWSIIANAVFWHCITQ